jgi:hypothetical protein
MFDKNQGQGKPALQVFNSMHAFCLFPVVRQAEDADGWSHVGP